VSHASGNVRLGKLPETRSRAEFTYDGSSLDADERPAESVPVGEKHRLQQEKLKRGHKTLRAEPFQCLSRTGETGGADYYCERR